MDFTLIKRAGLTQREFADFCGVSRVTTNMWATGKMAPHRYIKDRIASALEGIGTAVANEQLPLAKSTPKHLRASALKDILGEPLVG